MTPSNINSLSITESQKIIHNAAEGRDIEIDRLLSAVQTIFHHSVKRSELEEVHQDLTHLIERYDIQPSHPQQSTKFVEIARLLVKSVELDHDIPEDIRMHAGYHGEVISNAIHEAYAYARKSGKRISLRNFARNYCTSVFKKNDPKKEKNLYLIRLSTSIPNRTENGTQKMFFVITARAKGKSNLIHELILREMNTKDGHISWFNAAANGPRQINKKGVRHSSLFSLLSHTFRGYSPIQQGPYEEFDPASLTSPQLESQPDPIKEALLCPISLSYLVNPTITPIGNTYSETEIAIWLALSKRDPLTNSPCEEADLRKNQLIADLLKKFESKKPDQTLSEYLAENKNQTLSLFMDPLSKQLLEEPVIAPDGVTYSKHELKKYLAEDGGHLPNSKIPCSNMDLYPNRLVQELLSIIR